MKGRSKVSSEKEKENQAVLDPEPGALNVQDEKSSRNRSGGSGLSKLRDIIQSSTESSVNPDSGTYIALAMLVEEIQSAYPPGTIPSSKAEEGDELKTYIKIYARVPEFDSALPMPDVFKNFRPNSKVLNTRCLKRDLSLIRQHPFFIKDISGIAGLKSRFWDSRPTPGSLIRVSYNDKKKTSGLYLDIFSDGYNLDDISLTTTAEAPASAKSPTPLTTPKIKTTSDTPQIQTTHSLRDKFNTSSQNIANDDLGPLVTIGQMENKDLENRVIEIANNAFPGPVINGKQTILMFNLSPLTGISTSYNSFDLSHYGNKIQNLFVILESEEVLKPAIRVMLMSSTEGHNLKVNSSFRPSIPILTVGDILESVNRETEQPFRTYSNWNRIPNTQVGEINIYALKDFLETLNPNARILSSQRSLRDYFDCPNDTTVNCRVKVAPVGRSKHESGFAIDLNTKPPENYTWMVNNMHKYGFYRTVKSERWHWRFNNVNKKVNVFSVINRFHETWDGNSLPTGDRINSMPLKSDSEDIV